jgi:hypothetical protein
VRVTASSRGSALCLFDEFGLGLGVHGSPDGEVGFDLAAGLPFVRGVWAPCLDGVAANPAGHEAGALEVLAEVGNEAGVVESNSHLPQVPYLRFGADCARLDRSLASATADLEVAGLIALG